MTMQHFSGVSQIAHVYSTHEEMYRPVGSAAILHILVSRCHYALYYYIIMIVDNVSVQLGRKKRHVRFGTRHELTLLWHRRMNPAWTWICKHDRLHVCFEDDHTRVHKWLLKPVGEKWLVWINDGLAHFQIQLKALQNKQFWFLSGPCQWPTEPNVSP